MRIFYNVKVRKASIILTILHFIALIFTPGTSWSSDPTEAGFWMAAGSAIISTLVINWILVQVFTMKKGEKNT